MDIVNLRLDRHPIGSDLDFFHPGKIDVLLFQDFVEGVNGGVDVAASRVGLQIASLKGIFKFQGVIDGVWGGLPK